MCFSPYSLMSMRTIASWLSNMNSASARASSVLPTPVGPTKRNEPIGRSGSWSPARERRIALATALTASSWPTTRSCRRSSRWTSFAGLALLDAADRDAGPAGDDLGDVLGVDLLLEEAVRRGCRRGLALGLLGVGELLLELGDRAVAQLGGALEVALARGDLELALGGGQALAQVADAGDLLLLGLPLGLHAGGALLQVGELALERLEALGGRLVVLLALERGLLDLELEDAALDLVDLLGDGVDLDLHARGGLVDQVDRLVGQEAVGDVAVRERRGGDQRGVLDRDVVVHLVARGAGRGGSRSCPRRSARRP